jgi:hypothetical protein
MPVDVLVLLVYAAASARVAVLVAHDTILDGLRSRFFLRFPPEDRPGMQYQRLDRQGRVLPGGAIRPPHLLGELVSCTRCLTVWTTAAVYAVDVVAGRDATLLVTTPIAAMWAAAYLARKV